MKIDRRTFMKLPIVATLASKLKGEVPEDNKCQEKEKPENAVIGRVTWAETYKEYDFTRARLDVYHGMKVNFELPVAFELRKKDRIVFHDCRIKPGNGCYYIDNRSYSSLEIYRKGARKPSLTLDGREAYRRERTAAKRFALEDAAKI